MESDYPIVQQFLGAEVRRRRRACGLTQERLAEAAEIGVRHVQRIEAGRANAELRTLCLLAAALETTPAALLAAELDAER